MLTNAKSFTSFSVNDVDKAEDFYKNMLGLEVARDEGGLIVTTGGDTMFMIYPKDDHTPATYTVLNFTVEQLESEVQELKDKGVMFETYDGEYGITTDQNSIAQMGGVRAAWIKDPAGNVIGLWEGFN